MTHLVDKSMEGCSRKRFLYAGEKAFGEIIFISLDGEWDIYKKMEFKRFFFDERADERGTLCH